MMNEEQNPAPAPVSTPMEEPRLPDGLGLTIDQVRTLILQHNRIKTADNDPEFVIVTIMNAYLGEQEKLLIRHNKALTSILSQRTQDYVKAVAEVTDDLGRSLSSSTVKEFQIVIDRFRTSAFWLAGIIGISALVNVTVFVVLALMRSSS
jgi:hypothetical protein